MKTREVGEYKNCVELKSGDFTIAVTKDFGPRVIGGWIKGSDNIFNVMAPTPMKTVNTGFTLYGGHRLWISPEVAPRTYAPDNTPVEVKKISNGFEFKAAPEAISGVQKSIKITKEKTEKNSFLLEHIITNCGQWDITIAAWALSIMAPGGITIIPQSRDTRFDPFTPDRTLVLWPYTSTADKRLSLEDEYIFLRQDKNATGNAKIGFYTDDGWIAYVNNGVALVKFVEPRLFRLRTPMVHNGMEVVKFVDVYDRAAPYSDNGCNVEAYTCKTFSEIETLSPLLTLAPGDTIVHDEYWQAIAGLPEIKNSSDVKKYLEPKLFY